MSEQERANVAAALAAWRAELRAGSAQTAGFALNPVWFVLLDETGVDTPVTSIYARVPGNSAPSVAVGQTLEAADHPRRWRQMGTAANASRFGEIVAMTVPVATPAQVFPAQTLRVSPGFPDPHRDGRSAALIVTADVPVAKRLLVAEVLVQGLE